MTEQSTIECADKNAHFIYGEIDQDSIFRLLNFLIQAKGPTIYLYIDSTGGCLASAIAMCEALYSSGKKIITQAVDQVYSAAMLIYLCGDERYVSPHSSFLIHKAASTMKSKRDTPDALVERAQEMETQTTNLFEMITKRTKLTKKTIITQVNQSSDGDWFIYAKEALKYKISTHIGFFLHNGNARSSSVHKITKPTALAASKRGTRKI